MSVDDLVRPAPILPPPSAYVSLRSGKIHTASTPHAQRTLCGRLLPSRVADLEPGLVLLRDVCRVCAYHHYDLMRALSPID